MRNRRADMKYRKNLKNAAAASSSTRPPFDDGNLQDVVRAAIRELLASDPTILAVARALSMNVRTLQRRLAESGVSYRRLLDDCRREQAQEELGRQQTPVSEISKRLGYSDPAHFVRAFRRWTGNAPSRFCTKYDEEEG